MLVRMAYLVERGVIQEKTSPHPFRVVSMGASGNPTEELDRVAEAQVLSFMEQEGLKWNMLSEELGFVDRGGDRLLVVDPIDGSYNVLHGLPLGTISLALGKDRLSDVYAAVVHDLMSGTTYWASKGGGAFHDGVRIGTRKWEKGSDLFFINMNHKTSQRVREIALLPRRVRSLGSASLEISMVAKGSGDLYIAEASMELANLRVTDIAAARLILLEAGGGMAKADGSSIDMPLSLKDRTSVLAWGSKDLFDHGRAEKLW